MQWCEQFLRYTLAGAVTPAGSDRGWGQGNDVVQKDLTPGGACLIVVVGTMGWQPPWCTPLGKTTAEEWL